VHTKETMRVGVFRRYYQLKLVQVCGQHTVPPM
jgi:hypothetical protein